MQETDTAVQAASQVEEGSKPRYRELEFGVRSIQVRESDDGAATSAPSRICSPMHCA